MGKLSTALIGDDPWFDGKTYDPAKDQKRITGQLLNVYSMLLDHRWHTLNEMAIKISGSEAGVSARIRDLRKPRFGSHYIEKRRVSNGLWQYRMVS